MGTRVLFLTEIEEEAGDLEDACGFLILIPHTEVKKKRTAESHDLPAREG